MRRRPALLFAAGLGYLAGTFPSADVASRIAGAGDIRAQGTGNPGAANAIGVLGKGLGYGVLVADIAKATLAGMAGRRIAGDDGAHVGSTMAVVGHCYPVWNRFQGGKGVAASVGQALVTFPAYFLPDLALAGVTAVIPWWRQRAFTAVVVSSAAWTGAGVLWWKKQWPNLWGPRPTAMLPLASAATSAIIVERFRAAARHNTPGATAVSPHPTIGIVTDSNSQIPDTLVSRFGIEVVPLTVTVDGTPYREGVDLSADEFYAMFANGATPDVSTAAPAPGAFLAAYERLAYRGVEEILSIHIGADVSGTLNAARVGSGAAPVPVRLVDTGTASFGVACCVWEACLVLEGGQDADAAVAVAETLAPTVGNVFVVGALDLARAGGRLADDDETAHGVAVLSLIDGQIQRLGNAANLDAATEMMTSFITEGRDPLRVAVGRADAGAGALCDALEASVGIVETVEEVMQYRIGPSVGAHTGPGTAGAFFWPVGGQR